MRLPFFLSLVLLISPAFAAPKKSYQYFRVGNAADVTTTPSGGTVLMGGGTDVDAAFQWMCNRSGGGDFLVIRATGTDAYNPYIQQICPAVNSVATLIIGSSTAANDPFVAATLQQAEAVFIAGGDQANYVNYWTGTPVQTTLNQLIANNVPVGGTSAGLNILSQFVYSALLSQGVTSSQALADPYNKYITLARDFAAVQNLAGLIADPHFTTRDRMGRDLAFLCRIYNNGWSSTPRGISVDEQTALLINPNGSTSVTGSGNVYFLQAPGAPTTCMAKTPLTYRNIAVYRIAQGAGTFDLGRWSGNGGLAYSVTAEAGVVSSTQPGGDIY